MPAATAVGLGAAMIFSEHTFSAMLSSPWTTEKFATSPEDKETVRKYYMIATAMSLVVAVILGKILNQPWPLLATAVLCGIYIMVYEKALRGGI